MKSRSIRFSLILLTLIIYTLFKVIELMPAHILVAIGATALLFSVILGATFIYRSDASVFDRVWFRALAWSGSLVMGVWATFFIISVPADIVRALLSVATFVSGIDLTLPDRFSYIVSAAPIAGLATAFTLMGFLEVLRGPTIREVTIPLDSLHPALANFKIAQISDLHVGPTIRRNYVESTVRLINGTEPDIIVITGDLTDAHAASIIGDLAPLGKLRARYGIFYVTGNHEYYWGVEALIAAVKNLGITPLINENHLVQVQGGANMLVAGVTDPMGRSIPPSHTPDIRKALAHESAASHFKILLAHRPDPYKEAEPLGVDLQFSGHTHSGQFFPFNLLIGFVHKYYRGLARYGKLSIYVNPGTGYWGPANRLGIPSEITLARLTQTESQ